MKNGIWHTNLTYADSLEVMQAEIENLENDELSMEEAGFLQGYEEDMYELYEPYEESGRA